MDEPKLDKMRAPNAIRMILLILSAASFIPQLRKLLARRECVGLDPQYILINLVVATQQFALELVLIDNNNGSMVVSTPPSLGDWLNFAQFTVVWVGHLIVFVAYLLYPPSPPAQKRMILFIYVSFLFVSVIPAIFIALLLPEGTDTNNDRSWPLAIFHGISSMFINPIITALAFAAFFPQARELQLRSDAGSLSLEGLVVQAVVFLVVGVFWLFRDEVPFGVAFISWYQLVGWATLNNLIFAFVQGFLWLIARRLSKPTEDSNIARETSPLIEA